MDVRICQGISQSCTPNYSTLFFSVSVVVVVGTLQIAQIGAFCGLWLPRPPHLSPVPVPVAVAATALPLRPHRKPARKETEILEWQPARAQDAPLWDA